MALPHNTQIHSMFGRFAVTGEVVESHTEIADGETVTVIDRIDVKSMDFCPAEPKAPIPGYAVSDGVQLSLRFWCGSLKDNK